MKKVISLMMIVLIGAALLVSCSGSPSPSPTPTPTDPTYTPTLTAYNVKEVFPKGTKYEDAKAKGYFGSLEYRDEKGNITTIRVADSTEVTIDGYEPESETAEDEVRTLIFHYKGLSASKKYRVYKLEIPEVNGTFVIGKNQTLTFDPVKYPKKDKAVITTYENFMLFYNYMWTGDKPEEGVEEEAVDVEYKFIADTNRVKIVVKGTSYASDGNGGLQSYVRDTDILEPEFDTVYIAEKPFPVSQTYPVVVRGKWLAFKAYDKGFVPMENAEDYCWKFYLLDSPTGSTGGVPTFQINADKLSFDVSGVYVDKKTVLDPETQEYAKNFQAGPNRDSTYTEFKGLSVVSYYVDKDWPGYSAILFPKN